MSVVLSAALATVVASISVVNLSITVSMLLLVYLQVLQLSCLLLLLVEAPAIIFKARASTVTTLELG